MRRRGVCGECERKRECARGERVSESVRERECVMQLDVCEVVLRSKNSKMILIWIFVQLITAFFWICWIGRGRVDE